MSKISRCELFSRIDAYEFERELEERIRYLQSRGLIVEVQFSSTRDYGVSNYLALLLMREKESE